MNISQFQILLQEAIDLAADTQDYLLLARALTSLQMGQIRSVSTFANLPTAASNEGLLVWVTADERLYWSTGSAWYPIVTNNRAYALSWGANDSRLGDNTNIQRSSPVSVVGGISDWRQVSAGGYHTIALRSNGAPWAWGFNQFGQLGDNTSINRSSPVSIMGGFTDWCQISGGERFSVAVRLNGTTWSWGYNSSGQLGDNTSINRSSPVSVVGGFTDWCQVTAGFSHSAAMRTNGTIWSWGRGLCGGLGNLNVTDTSSPVSVVGGFTDWSQVNAGIFQSVGIKTSGTAWTWGYNNLGQLGDNTTTNRSSPVSVVGGFANWCQVSAGSNRVVALRTSGTAWAWGSNSVGQLGDNTTTNRSSPVSVVGGFTNWCQISAGASSNHSLAVRTNNTAWSWGFNTSAQLGDLTATNRSSPVSVVGGLTNWCQVSAGRSFSTGIIYDDFV